MTTPARTLLRRIALGLPLAGVTLVSGCAADRCPQADEQYAITSEQITALESGASGCADVCRERQSATGRPAAALVINLDSQCRLVDADGGRVLACHFVGQCGG